MPVWIRRLLGHHPHEDKDLEVPATPGQRAADAALGRAEEARASVQAQREEVEHEAHAWKLRRENNHFAQLIRNVVLGGDQ